MTVEAIVVIGCFLFLLLFTGGMVLKAPAGQKRLYFFGGLVVSAGLDLLLIPGFLEYWVLTRFSLLSLHSLHILVLMCAPTGVIVFIVGLDTVLINPTRIFARFEGRRAILLFCLLVYVYVVLVLIPLEPLVLIEALYSSLQVPVILLLVSMILVATGLMGAFAVFRLPFAVFRLHVTWRSSHFGWALARIIGGILLFLVIFQMFLQLE